MQLVINHLKSISHQQLSSLLDEKHAVDSRVGIVLVSLPGEMISTTGYTYHFHGARVLTGHANFVKPHYHKIGEEPYHILSGSNGEMNLGVVQDNRVVWKEPQEVAAGDVIVVKEREVHSLRNRGEESLDFTFACPDEHLIDHGDDHPEGDRYFTKDLEDGIPSWYPKA